jgi:hypothetical protein
MERDDGLQGSVETAGFEESLAERRFVGNAGKRL